MIKCLKRVKILCSILVACLLLSSCGTTSKDGFGSFASKREDGADPKNGIIYSKDGIDVEFKDITYEGDFWYYVNVKVTNNTENDISITNSYPTLNDIMVQMNGAIECPANSSIDGKFTIDHLYFSRAVGWNIIEKIEKIGFELNIYYGEDISDHFKSDSLVTIELKDPFDISEATYDMKYDIEKRETVFENELVEITVLGVSEDFLLREKEQLFILVKNKTDLPIKLSNDVKYNDFSEILESLEKPDTCIINETECKCNITSMYISEHSSAIIPINLRLDDNNINLNEINKIQMGLKVQDRRFWDERIEDCPIVLEINF